MYLALLLPWAWGAGVMYVWFSEGRMIRLEIIIELELFNSSCSSLLYY